MWSSFWKSVFLHYLLIYIIHTSGQFTFGRIKWNYWKNPNHSFSFLVDAIRSSLKKMFGVGNSAMPLRITKSHYTQQYWRLYLSSRHFFWMFGIYRIFIEKLINRKILLSVFAELAVRKEEILINISITIP